MVGIVGKVPRAPGVSGSGAAARRCELVGICSARAAGDPSRQDRFDLGWAQHLPKRHLSAQQRQHGHERGRGAAQQGQRPGKDPSPRRARRQPSRRDGSRTQQPQPRRRRPALPAGRGRAGVSRQPSPARRHAPAGRARGQPRDHEGDGGGRRSEVQARGAASRGRDGAQHGRARGRHRQGRSLGSHELHQQPISAAAREQTNR